jgi:hypothetical protein
MTAQVFYWWWLRKVADVDIPKNTGDFRLLDRKVVDDLKEFRQHGRFLRGLVSYIGSSRIDDGSEILRNGAAAAQDSSLDLQSAGTTASLRATC